MNRYSVTITPTYVEDVAVTEDNLADVLTAAGYRVERSAFRRAPLGGWRVSAHVATDASPRVIRDVVLQALDFEAVVRPLKAATR